MKQKAQLMDGDHGQKSRDSMDPLGLGGGSQGLGNATNLPSGHQGVPHSNWSGNNITNDKFTNRVDFPDLREMSTEELMDKIKVLIKMDTRESVDLAKQLKEKLDEKMNSLISARKKYGLYKLAKVDLQNNKFVQAVFGEHNLDIDCLNSLKITTASLSVPFVLSDDLLVINDKSDIKTFTHDLVHVIQADGKEKSYEIPCTWCNENLVKVFNPKSSGMCSECKEQLLAEIENNENENGHENGNGHGNGHPVNEDPIVAQTAMPSKGKCPESDAVRYMSQTDLVQNDWKADCPEGKRRLEDMKSVSLDEYKRGKEKEKKKKKKNKKAQMVTVKVVPEYKEHQICPHCNNEIIEKSLYFDNTNWFHRPCLNDGPIFFEKKAGKKGPKHEILKKNKKPLTEEERKEVMDAGATWHHGPNGEETPAIWKAEVKDKIWYICNTHRAMQVKPTLEQAIKSYDFIKTTAQVKKADLVIALFKRAIEENPMEISTKDFDQIINDFGRILDKIGIGVDLSSSDFYDFYGASHLLGRMHLLRPAAVKHIVRVVDRFAKKIYAGMSGAIRAVTVAYLSTAKNNWADLEQKYGTLQELGNDIADEKISIEQLRQIMQEINIKEKQWLTISEEIMKLGKILPTTEQNITDIIIQVDHIVDLGHTTGKLFGDYITVDGVRDEDDLQQFLNEKSEDWDEDFYKENAPQMYNLLQRTKQYAKLLKGLHRTADESSPTFSFTTEERAIINKVKEAADALNIDTYLVGGAVRDRLLNKPNSDLDFMCEKDVEKLVQYLIKKHSLSTPIQYDRSQAIMVRLDNQVLDFINAEMLFRPLKEDKPLEGDEEFTTSFDDAYRRDLTINSLMHNIRENKIEDPTGQGFKDLKMGLINTVIDPMIKYKIHAPDMLRALRFAVKLGFELAPGMLEAMRANAEKIRPRDEGGDISNRRIRRELRKTIDTPEHWAKMRELLHKAGLSEILSEDIKDVQQDMVGGIKYPSKEEEYKQKDEPVFKQNKEEDNGFK